MEVQKQLRRVKTPRVNIQYDVEDLGAVTQHSLPFRFNLVGFADEDAIQFQMLSDIEIDLCCIDAELYLDLVSLEDVVRKDFAAICIINIDRIDIQSIEKQLPIYSKQSGTVFILTHEPQMPLLHQWVQSLCQQFKTHGWLSTVSPLPAGVEARYAAPVHLLESIQLPAFLSAARIHQTLIHVMNNQRGVFKTVEALERHLNNWVAQYILLDRNSSSTVTAQYPLLTGKVELQSLNFSQFRLSGTLSVMLNHGFPNGADVLFKLRACT